MNRGLLLKAAHEMWPATLLCGVWLFGVEAALAYVLPTFEAQLADAMRQIGFVKTFVGVMLGVNMSGQMGPEAIQAYAWVHPVVLALVWTHALVCCTRTPAGEVDRGTADVIFTLPVTRWEILRSETAVWLAATLVVLGLTVLGNLVGASFTEEDEPMQWPRLLIVLANLLCMILAVGGLAWLVSAVCDRRGTAIAIAFGLLLTSFLLNFLAQFWSVAEHLSFLGLLNYFRPLFVFRDGTIPWHDMGILLAAAIGLWTAAGVVFSRRDVCTV
jgi:ABC-2 type transport system permease protein